MSRILLATFGSLGDLHPTLAVGRAIVARGEAPNWIRCFSSSW